MKLIQVQIAGKPASLVCVHWKSFPPQAAFAVPETPEQLRAKKTISEADYQRTKVWQKVCGLTVMEQEKCLACPHVRTAEFQNELPGLMTLDRKSFVPSLDLPSLESSSRHRKFLASMKANTPRG